MGHALAFDTLAYSKRLKEAGVPEKQAEAHAEAFAEIIDEQLATKHDLKELEVSLKLDIEKIRGDMKEMEMRLTICLGVMLTAGIAIVATLVKLL